MAPTIAIGQRYVLPELPRVVFEVRSLSDAGIVLHAAFNPRISSVLRSRHYLLTKAEPWSQAAGAAEGRR